MKICPLCGSAMQDTEQFCASCNNLRETHEENQQMSQPAEWTLPTPPVPESTAPDALIAPVRQQPAPNVTQQAQPMQGNPAPDAVLQPPVSATAQQPQSQPQPQMPPIAAPGNGQPQQGGASTMYGAQAAYGQPQNPYAQPGYAQQTTYSPYEQGTVPPPPVQPNSMYQPAPMQGYYQDETVSLGEWMLNYLIMIIPIANIVMLCVWSFGNSAKVSVRNWARASLIWVGIGILFAIAFFIFMGVMVSSILSYAYGY